MITQKEFKKRMGISEPIDLEKELILFLDWFISYPNKFCNKTVKQIIKIYLNEKV
jgi:hypothetical protein